MPDKIDTNTDEFKKAVEAAAAEQVKALKENNAALIAEKRALADKMKALEGIDADEYKRLKSQLEADESKKLEELRQRNLGAPLKVASGGGIEGGSGGGRLLAFSGSGEEKKALAARLGFAHESAVDTVLTQVNKGIRDNVEYLSLIHPDGHLLIEEKGSINGVSLGKIDGWIKRNPGVEFISSHNHPISSDISAEDVYCLGNLRKMLIAGHDGVIIKTGVGRDKFGAFFSQRVFASGAIELEDIVASLIDKYRLKRDRLINGGWSFVEAENKALKDLSFESAHIFLSGMFTHDGVTYLWQDAVNREIISQAFVFDL